MLQYASFLTWMREHGVKTLRICVGIVYFWFGALKFAPEAAIETYLPAATVRGLSLNLLDNHQALIVLAVWECFIGYCLMTKVLIRPALVLLLAHLGIMFLPAVLWPGQIWQEGKFPYGLTLKGQYVVKNLVFISSALLLVARIPRPASQTSLGPLRALHRADAALAGWVDRHGLLIVRIGLGVVYFWFGILKYFPDVSPAEQLAAKTVEKITLGLMPPAVGLPTLATWEVLIGIGLLAGFWLRPILLLICVHLIGTFTPLFFYPDEVWTTFPFALTLEGKYIVRNLVLYGAALMIGAELTAKRRALAGDAATA